METPFEFFDGITFYKDSSFRMEGASTMGKDALYLLFLKNFIGFVFFKTDYHDCIEIVFEDDYELLPTQFDVAKVYSLGNLKVKYQSSNHISPLDTYLNYELSNIPLEPNEDVSIYLHYIIENQPLFKRIDTLVNKEYDAKAGSSFMTYLSTYGLILPHSNIHQLGIELDNYFMLVCKVLAISYIEYMNESLFLKDPYNDYFKKVFLAMNYDLLDEDEQSQLVKLSTRWLIQRFKSFAFAHHMQYAIGETSGAFLFQPFIDRFVQYFSFGSSKTEEKDYSKHIFSSWEAYHLFDTIAQGLTIKVSLSYLYRLLEEKRLIVAKDTPFRTWYNEQSYPLKLSTATETLLNSKNNEREQFVAIVAKTLGVSL